MSEHLSEIPDFDLPSLVDDPRHHALKLAAKRHVEEIYSLLGGDLDFLRDFYNEIVYALDDDSDDVSFNDIDESDPRVIEIRERTEQSLRDIEADYQVKKKQMDEEWEQERVQRLRDRSSWSVTQDFFRHHPTGRRWSAVIQKTWPTNPPKDPQAHVIKIFETEADIMAKIDPDFREYAAQSGHEVTLLRKSWIQTASSEEIAEKKGKIIFLDDDVLRSACFRGHIAAAIRDSILANAPEKLAELGSYKARIPEAFTHVFPEDFDLWPARISSFHEELSMRLKEGIQIKEARSLGEKYHLDDYHIVIKTWLDQKVESGDLEKSRRDGKVAYFSPGYAPITQ